MQTPIYYIDAFTDKLFSGNPAAVVFSDINDAQLMQNIAVENNLSETAFIREEDAVDAAAVAELPRVALALPLFLRAIVYYSNRNYSVEFDV